MSRRVVTSLRGHGGSRLPARACCRSYTKRQSIYQKIVPLAPGMYRLNVVAKDVVGGNMNNYEVALMVPRLDSEKLLGQQPDPGRSDREGADQEHRHRPVRDRRFQSPAAR